MTLAEVAHNHNLVRNDFFKDFDTYILPNFKHNQNSAIIWRSITHKNVYCAAENIIAGLNDYGEPVIVYRGEKHFKSINALNNYLTTLLCKLPQITIKYKSLLVKQKLADIEKDF